jgi:hypothetical protein
MELYAHAEQLFDKRWRRMQREAPARIAADRYSCHDSELLRCHPSTRVISPFYTHRARCATYCTNRATEDSSIGSTLRDAYVSGCDRPPRSQQRPMLCDAKAAATAAPEAAAATAAPAAAPLPPPPLPPPLRDGSEPSPTSASRSPQADRGPVQHCSLLQLVSNLEVCVPGVTFGCDGDGSMWAQRGCRGAFICEGVRIGICGIRYSLERDVCACTRNETARAELRARLREQQTRLHDVGTRAGAAPLPNAMHLDAAWMEMHVQSLRTLSSKLRRDHLRSADERERLLQQPPCTIQLSTCGALMVPYGGAMLAQFETHLRSFVIGSAGGMVEVSDAARHGFGHVVTAYTPNNASALHGYANVPLVMRRRKSMQYFFPDDPTSHCFQYRLVVWNGYIQWLLGELGVFAKVHLVWISWSSLLLYTVVERAVTLTEVLAQSAPPEDVVALADAVLEHLQMLARTASLVNMDVKPKDLLMRRVGHVEARLGDFEVHGKYRAGCGVVPGLPTTCGTLLNLQLPVVIFACGPFCSAPKWQRGSWLARSTSNGKSTIGHRRCNGLRSTVQSFGT